MGGGGGGSFSSKSPGELRAQVRDAEAKAVAAAFEPQLAGLLGELLASYNDRDHARVTERLDEIREALQGEMEGSFDRLFGGSVAKHTYVDGLSDIDSIIALNGTGLEGASPQAALQKMELIIRGHLGGAAEVSHGRMAVTVQYQDGMVIQLLPALRVGADRLKVPSFRGNAWSDINPVAFQEALTRRNEECNGKLVPTIKLAKAINGQLPEAQRLSGYHIESLAIAAFKAYPGPMTTSAMLPKFFERASNLVLNPIRDRTGQSIHVDEYLGPQNSNLRQVASHLMGRIARRMTNANAAGSVDQWKTIFGDEP